MDPKQYVVSTIIDEYLQEKDPAKQALLENKYKAAAQELERDKPLDKSNKTSKQSVLEKIIDQYLKADSPGVQKGLKEKYAAVQKLGEGQAPKLLTMDSNLGKFLSNPKAPEIVANHKHLKGQSALTPENVDYTKCDLPLIAKCKEVHEKSTKGRDYDKLSTIQKVGMAFATVVPIIGNVVAYYAMKSHNKSEKAKLEATIDQSLDGIKGDLDTLSKKPKQPKELEASQHKEKEGKLNQIKKLFSPHKANKFASAVPNNKKPSAERGIV